MTSPRLSDGPLMSIASNSGTSSSNPMHVAQALHGYRKGHELLAASHRLSRDGSRTLLELSDLSGPAARTLGFESYITGYPVPGEHLYAIARTWLATEGGRPGSVWTHTLLLTPEQLATFDLVNVTKWFRRPTTTEQALGYGRPLKINREDMSQGPRGVSAFPLAAHGARAEGMFEALYGSDSAALAILLPAESSNEYEHLVLHAWSLQWAELRGHFSFCTGALSARHVEGHPFDLQVVPQDRAATIQRSAPPGTYVVIGGRRSASGTWDDYLPSDRYDMRRARSFIWRFGPELTPERLSFGHLAQLRFRAESLSNRAEWQALLEVVDGWYPRSSSAPKLKAWALTESASNLADPLTDFDRLFVLSRLRRPSAYSKWRSSLADAFLRTFSTNGPEVGVVLSEIIAFASTPARLALLQLSTEHLNPGAFVALIEASPDDAASRALDLRPSILGEPALWRSERSRHRALMWLATSNDVGTLIVATVRAVVAANQPVGLGDLVDRAGVMAIDAAFDVLDEDAELAELGPEWIANLRGHPKQGISWLARSERPSAKLARLVLDRLRPGDCRLRVVGHNRWMQIVGRVEPHTADGASVQAFALGVGFHDGRRSASSLVAAVFQAVYDSAVEGRLGEDDWSKLKRVFPGSRRVFRRLIRGDGSGRDRALRRAVVEAFGQKGWPITNFLEAVTDMAVLSSVATENLRTKPGQVLRRRLNAKIKRGDLILSGPQRTALNSWIDS